MVSFAQGGCVANVKPYGWHQEGDKGAAKARFKASLFICIFFSCWKQRARSPRQSRAAGEPPAAAVFQAELSGLPWHAGTGGVSLTS